MPTPVAHAISSDRRRSIGQSIVEFALLFPVVLLIVMMGLDFGRVYLGWVNLNNTARIAANYAATNATKMAANDPVAFDAYYQLVQNDAQAINCKLPPKLSFPGPTYPTGTALGEPAHVAISCTFNIITPVISNILGSPITVSAAADFPIRTGVIAGVPGGGGSGVVAKFNFAPLGGTAPRTINFTDFSTGNPTSWAWDFNGDGTVDSTSQTTGNAFTYTIPGTYHASLTVSNGTSTDTAVHDIFIGAPPGPVVQFTALPAGGPAPLLVKFTNTSTGAAPLTYLWDYGDGSPTSNATVAPDHTYAAGSWVVKLTVTDSFNQSNFGTAVITVSPKQCAVPDFTVFNTSEDIQGKWIAAGFKTTVIFNPSRPPDYPIKKQDLQKNKQQPCDTAVQTVFK